MGDTPGRRRPLPGSREQRLGSAHMDLEHIEHQTHEFRRLEDIRTYDQVLLSVAHYVREALILELGETRATDKVAYYRLRLRALAIVRDVVNAGIRLSAVEGVKEEALSRKLAAHLIGQHQVTIGRWVKEDSDPDSRSPFQLPASLTMDTEKLLADDSIDYDDE